MFTINKATAREIAAKNKPKFTDTVPIEIGLWSDGKYFDYNPDKVGGELVVGKHYKTGKPEDQIHGDMETAISVLPNPAPTFNNWLITPAEPHPPLETTLSAITKSLLATKYVEQHPPSKTGTNLLSFDEVRERYSSEISNEQYKIWAIYQKGRMFNTVVVSQKDNGWAKFLEPISHEEYMQFFEDGMVAYDGVSWIPEPIFYGGAVYERLSEIDASKSSIVEKIGIDGFDLQRERLIAAFPERLVLSAPKNERLIIKAFDHFIHKFKVEGFTTGRTFGEPTKMMSAFWAWLEVLPPSSFKFRSNYHDIKVMLYERGTWPPKMDKETKQQRLRNAQMDLQNLFSDFLSDILLEEDQQKIEYEWNRTYNGWKEIDFKKIPVGFEINSRFGDGPIRPMPPLWESVRFFNSAGSGVNAFDVGVGKTMASILGIADALYTGQCKRPVVIVPNPTYHSWLQETVGRYDKKTGEVLFEGVIPQYRNRINDYHNLDAPHRQRLLDNPPQDYTITFITYEALKHIGMSKEFEAEMGRELFHILDQSTTDREREQQREKVGEFMGNLTAETKVNLDELGWDYVVLDEGHNMKKLFTNVKGKTNEEGKKEASRHQITSGGEPSARAVKMFMFSQFIMRRNNMRNVVLLTATPFTNSPLEIFSMLVLVAYQKLKDRGINNIGEFFDKFVLETNDLVVSPANQITEKVVIKEFNNRIVLQNLIFSYMLHKTGEEAKVKRPTKVVYPRLKDKDGFVLPLEEQVDTALPATEQQAYWFKEIANLALGRKSRVEDFLGEHYYDTKTGKLNAATLLAVTFGRQAVLSPYLLRSSDEIKETESGKKKIINYTYWLGKEKVTVDELFESSPKLLYTRGCLKTIVDHHRAKNEPIGGVVIYIDGAKDYHAEICDHLADYCGLDRSKAAFLNGDVKGKDREPIKEGFNNGEIVILIGSSTIKEGINLQKRATTLFNLTLPWNPTDIHQLEGRIHRQKNQHSHVRIVTPLIENSVDVFLFQKLEEKTSRINDIWFRAERQNVLDTDEFDPKELKLGLMTNPEDKARVEQDQEAASVEHLINIQKEQLADLKDAQNTIDTFNDQQVRIAKWYDEAKQRLKVEKVHLQAELKLDEYTRKDIKEKHEKRVIRIDTLFETDKDPENKPKSEFAIIKNWAKANEVTAGGNTDYDMNERIGEVDRQTKRIQMLDRLQKNVLAQHKMTVADNLDDLIDTYQAEFERLGKQLIEVKSDEFRKDLVESHKEVLEELKKESLNVSDRVRQFTKHNYLLSCMRELHKCSVDHAIITNKPPEDKVIDITPMQPDLVKEKRIKIARARAAAIQIQLDLLA